jgi:hypothetical protein
MAVGLYTLKSDIDVRAGQLAQALRNTLTEISDFKKWLDTQTDQNLTDLACSAGDIASYRSSYIDLDKLNQIYLGLATQTPAYDFQTFAKLLG